METLVAKCLALCRAIHAVCGVFGWLRLRWLWAVRALLRLRLRWLCLIATTGVKLPPIFSRIIYEAGVDIINTTFSKGLRRRFVIAIRNVKAIIGIVSDIQCAGVILPFLKGMLVRGI